MNTHSKSVSSPNPSSTTNHHQPKPGFRQEGALNSRSNTSLDRHGNVEHRDKCFSKANRTRMTCILCFFIGFLVGSIALTTALTVWLGTTATTTTVTTIAWTSASTTTITTTNTPSTSVSSTSQTMITITTTTSTTSITSTTSTTSTTATTTTTPTPPCTPTSVGSAGVLYSTASSSIISFTCFCYAWTAPKTGQAVLTFQLRHDPNYWYLDDVFVYAGTTQLLVNPGFETGSLSPWVQRNINGCSSTFPAGICSSFVHSGFYSVWDGSSGCPDQVSQTFSVTSGQIYVVSFWLMSGTVGANISAKVTLT